ncbi:MAG: hypothetical protein NTV39_02505 [Candidatus Saccharibacteria bacterium]|nr:hypothetical protein [Candidatus Saccharibacteria bacterium]
MKKYIADVLSGMRLIIAFAIAPAILLHLWPLATMMFLVALATDAMDGIAARRWPYPADEHHWWRKDSHLVDNIPDGALTFAVLLWLAIDSPIWWLVMAGSVIGTGVILFLIAYVGRFSPAGAEKIDVIYGWTYAALLAAMLVTMTIHATDRWPVVVFIYLAGGAWILVTKWDRATTRPETRERFM